MYEVANPQDYCTLAELLAHIPAGNPAENALIGELISRASRYIDRYKRVPDSYYNNGGEYCVAVVHRFNGNGEGELWIDRCTLIDSVYLEDAAGTLTLWVDGTDFYSWPYNTEWIARLDINVTGTRAGWPSGQRNVLVAARWGAYEATPEEVKEVCIIIVSRLIGRGRQMFRDTGAITELARLLYSQPIDPQAKQILDQVPGRINVG